jgi:HprK-related kinase A
MKHGCNQQKTVLTEIRMLSKVFDLHLHPFSFRLSTNHQQLFAQLQQIYPTQILTALDANHFIDFEVTFSRPNFAFSSALAFKLGDKHFRFAEKNALIPTFEWGLNWCVGNFQSRYLCIHAAVLEKNGFSVVLPAPPGSGKSTLCAMLMFAGWRLLSDEHCLIDINDGLITPCVRPISLKNHSIQVVKQLYPQSKIEHITPNTHKGTIGYVPPSELSWQQYQTKVKPFVVIFPRYRKEQDNFESLKLNQHQYFMQLAENSFNYSVLGVTGFETMANFVANVQAFNITYNNGDQAISFIEDLCR